MGKVSRKECRLRKISRQKATRIKNSPRKKRERARKVVAKAAKTAKAAK